MNFMSMWLVLWINVELYWFEIRIDFEDNLDIVEYGFISKVWKKNYERFDQAINYYEWMRMNMRIVCDIPFVIFYSIDYCRYYNGSRFFCCHSTYLSKNGFNEYDFSLSHRSIRLLFIYAYIIWNLWW